LVKKPSTAGVHQHGVPLKFEELERGDFLTITQWTPSVLRKETFDILGGTIQNNGNIFIASIPRIEKQLSRLLLIQGIAPISQPVESLAQGFPPVLIPYTVSASRIASAMAVPASHAVSATPGAVLNDLGFISGREFLQILTIVRQFREILFLDIFQRK